MKPYNEFCTWFNQRVQEEPDTYSALKHSLLRLHIAAHIRLYGFNEFNYHTSVANKIMIQIKKSK